VTHDQVEAMTLGDRVVVMKDGLVQQVGEPMELYGKPANKFVAGFIGSPAMNFAEVTIAESGGGLWAEASGIRVKVPPSSTEAMRPHAGKHATLGMRPEALRLANGADPVEYVFDATVDVVEPLGSEILLNLSAGPQALVARVDPAVSVKTHERVRLAIDPAKLHFFDHSTEAAI
jgi:multiple sugar transport system ATP-binding protein